MKDHPAGWLGDLALDFRIAFRTLAKSRAFTFIAVGSLALGIGVNTGLFSVVHATWLEPVPGVNGADRVVEVLGTYRGRDVQEWAYPDFQDVSEAETPIEALAAWKDHDGSLTQDGASQRVRVTYASADYFHVLGVMPMLGRGFLASEDVGPGQHPVAVVSYDMWQHRLGADPNIVGKTIVLNRSPYTVVGVVPEAFKGHMKFRGGTDLWVPLMQHPYVSGPRGFVGDRNVRWLLVLGRLRDGATLDQTNAALQTVMARLEELYPQTNADERARAAAFGPMPAQGRSASMFATLSLVALACLVLLIICGNVAGMLLVRSAARQREIAVRLALGCGRGRLVRLLMVEALILASVGAVLGSLIAIWATGTLSPAGLGMEFGNAVLRPDPAVLGFSLALALATTLAVGLLPAIRFSQSDLVVSLKEDAGGGGRRVGRVHKLAASAQTGLAILLLIVCSLFVRALNAMDSRDLGFEPKNLVIVRSDLSLEGYASQAEGEAFLDRVSESLASLPGVASVAVADGIPLDLIGNYTSVARADRPDEAGGRVTVEFTRAGAGYFKTIGTPILRGREFVPTDDASSEPVVVITQSLAQRMWPGEDVLGRRLAFSLSRDARRDHTIVGVVGNVASSRAEEDQPHVFVPLRQNYRPRTLIAIRGAVDAEALVRPIQTAILEVDPSLPIPAVIASETLVSRSTQGQRATVGMAGGLGLLALLLSAIGVYGVVAFAVTSRTREIGLRMALGATRERVLGTVIRDAVRLAVPGLVVGALTAVAIAFAMESMLLGVSPADPVALFSAAGVLFVVVLLASLVPARRASGIDPMVALRSE